MTQDVHKTPSSQILANVAASISQSEDKESSESFEPSGKSSSISKKEQQSIKEATSNITRLANSKAIKNDKPLQQDKVVPEKSNLNEKPMQQDAFAGRLKAGQDILQAKAEESLNRLKNLLSVMQDASLEMNSSVEKVCTDHIRNSRQIHSTLLDTFQKASHLTIDSFEDMAKAKNVGDVLSIQMNWMQNMPSLYVEAVKTISTGYAETFKKCTEEAQDFVNKSTSRKVSSRK